MATITGSKRHLDINSSTVTTSSNIDIGAKLFISTTDTNTTSTTALVLNSNEVEQRTLGSNAFTSYTDHSTQGYLTTVTFGDITGTPTTISGYGITDAFDGAYGSLSSIPSTFAPSAHNQAWSTITGTPTTISGYGITDAFDGAYSSLTGVPSLGTAAASAATDFVAVSGDTITGNLLLQDSVELILGTDTDLKIYHDGTNGRIANNTGHLYIQNLSDDKDIILRSDDGSGGLETYLNIDGSLGQVSVPKPFVVTSNATISGELYTGANLTVGDGTDDSKIIIKNFNATSEHIEFYHGSTRVGEIGAEDTTWLRINQETNKNIYTPRYIRADNGFFVDGTTKGINGSGNFIGGTITGASDANVTNWDAAYTHSQAAHAPSNAEANVQSDWNATSGDALILNKPTIPTNNNQLTNGAGYITGIAANSVGITELNVSDGTSGQVLTTDGNGTLSFTTVSASGSNYYLDDITRTASTNTLVFSVNGTTDQSYTFGANAFTDTAIPVSGTDFDPVGTDNSTNVTLASVTGNYLSISGQEITAGTVPISLGGTGATTASAARTNLGVDPAGTDNSTDVSLVTTAANYLTISGQAITLAKPKLSEINGGATAGILTTNTGGVVSVDTSTYLTEVAFSDLISTPTTLSGYGITDADNYGSWSIQNGGGTATSITSGKHIRFDGASISGSGTSGDPYAVDLSSLNTTYSAGTGLTLSGTTFSVTAGTYAAASHTHTPTQAGLSNLSNSGNSLAGTFTATGDIIAYSDVRVKENIKDIDNALDKVSKLRGVEYNKIGSDEKSIGVIAQEIQKVLPEVVREDQDGMLGVSYGNITAVLIEAIKDQQKQIDELKSIIDGFTK